LPCGGNVLTLSPIMSSFKKLKDQTIAKVYAKVPSLVDLYARKADLVVNTATPFSPLLRPLRTCRVALITTAGLHLPEQEPFDMTDKNGDPSYREIPSDVGIERLTITHDYFPRTDAAADPNLVLPLDPLRELAREGVVGSTAPRFFSFMGHILGEHLRTLMETTAPEVARALKADAVDAVFLTPV
jgi:D-proline reductase (dithiol) PrdB